MSNFQRWLNYRILRMNVRTRQRRNRAVINSGYKLLTKEEFDMVKKIEELAIKFNDKIKFDPEADEVIIDIPDILVVLKKKGRIEVNNHDGFAQMTIPDNAFNLLMMIINREAHRDRRRLKYKSKQNLNAFIKKINT
jgi:hypothetical protein